MFIEYFLWAEQCKVPGTFHHEKVDMVLYLPGGLNMWKNLIEQVIARACYRAEIPVYRRDSCVNNLLINMRGETALDGSVSEILAGHRLPTSQRLPLTIRLEDLQ